MALYAGTSTNSISIIAPGTDANRPVSPSSGTLRFNTTTNSLNGYSTSWTNISQPSTVTSGLVLSLDAGNTASYPGSGTTWTDLSGNSNNGTLTNGPTFSQNNNGYFTLNGSTQYISIGSQSIVGAGSSPFTGELWWYNTRTLANGSYVMPVRVKQDSEFFLALYSPSGTYNLYGVFRGSTQWGTPVTNSDFINKWNCIHFGYTGGSKNTASSYKVWVNGVQIATGTNNYGAAGGTGSNCNLIGADGNSGCNTFFTDGFISGNVSVYRLYNRLLTDTEILQNFNAIRGRYGV